jgi:hypothetical protein
MLAGHYAPAYLLKARFPSVPLVALCVAVQAADVLFFILAPLGIEQIRLDTSVRGPLGMHLVSIPYSHSLTLTLACAAVLATAGMLARRPQLGLALALAAVSHWALDLLVREGDLPLTSAERVRVGFGLWRYTWLAYGLEIVPVIGALAWLARRVQSARARRWLLVSGVLLVFIQTVYVLYPPPPSALEIARNAEGIYLTMALTAWMVDRRTSSHQAMRPALR